MSSLTKTHDQNTEGLKKGGQTGKQLEGHLEETGKDQLKLAFSNLSGQAQPDKDEEKLKGAFSNLQEKTQRIQKEN